MSAPQTNIDRQKRRHRGPLIGIIAGLAVVALLFFVFVGDTVTPQSELLDGGAVAPQSIAPPTETQPPAAPTGN